MLLIILGGYMKKLLLITLFSCFAITGSCFTDIPEDDVRVQHDPWWQVHNNQEESESEDDVSDYLVDDSNDSDDELEDYDEKPVSRLTRFTRFLKRNSLNITYVATTVVSLGLLGSTGFFGPITHDYFVLPACQHKTTREILWHLFFGPHSSLIIELF